MLRQAFSVATLSALFGCAGFGAAPAAPLDLCTPGQTTAAWFQQRFPDADANRLRDWITDDVRLPRRVVVCPTAGERVAAKWTWFDHSTLRGPGVHRDFIAEYGPKPFGNPDSKTLRIEYPLPAPPEVRAELTLAYTPDD